MSHADSPTLIPGTGLTFVRDDGGRAAAGFRGTTGDCVTRAIAIATDLPYRQVYDDLNALAKAHERPNARRGRNRGRRSSARTGVFKRTYHRYLTERGWLWEPTMLVGRGCRVHLRGDELPGGRLIVSLSRHLSAVIDGVIHDLEDPSRAGTRCVYGYYYWPEIRARGVIRER